MDTCLARSATGARLAHLTRVEIDAATALVVAHARTRALRVFGDAENKTVTKATWRSQLGHS